MQQLTYPIRLTEEPRPWRGDPFDWTLAMAAGIDDDGTLTEPADLTGFGTSWASTARAGSDAVTFEVDASNAADGYVVLKLTGQQTAALLDRIYSFDVQVVGGARSPFTVWTGTFRADGDYTP